MKSKLKNSIEEIDVPSNIKDKEIDAEKKAKAQNIPTQSKLPFTKESVPGQSSKKKKHKKHKTKKGDNTSGGGDSSEESSSGNNSGIESGNEGNEDGTVDKNEN